jgi:hypothetical protein
MWNLRKQKFKTYKSVDEFLSTTDIPLLTIEELFDLVENNKIENKADKKIAEIILDAESDWIISILSLNDFLVVLEKEIDGNTTKPNLEKLLKKYNQNISRFAWETASVSYLLEIFELTNEKDLKTIFYNLTERINKK